ncbi:hypothetical protein GOP47_0025721 [Adiantum capillus-veneris]|uniref:NAD(P)-binding domain-containing protein n=1 Tax=Adiantum capillus-veneris TaxID=13818 RepID=A0A9D4U158_ADICA|nr:hypothetical protein GOP47_0025721 [Adiantum capillus-veneris]
MEKPLKVLVVGCSSGVGLQATKKLLEKNEHFEVIGLVRNQEKAVQAIGEEAGKVKFIKGDITKVETLGPACNGVDVVICTVGATVGWRLPSSNANTPKNCDYLGVKNLSEAAAHAKVPKFVLVSSMAVTRPWYPVALLLNTAFGNVLQWKLKGENCLREVYRQQSNLSYNIVRPGGLTNKKGGAKVILVDQGDKCSGMITREDVATVVLACVEGKCTPNSTFEIVNGDKEGGLVDPESLSRLVPDPQV